MTSNFTDKWAVLIGPNDYEHVTSLKYCTNDVRAVASALREQLEFPTEHLFTFGTGLPLKPTRGEIYHRLGEIRDQGLVKPDDLLLFYFSGHGFRDRKDYLLPADATPRNLKLTGIEVEELVNQLTGTGCKNIVMFIDACREVVEGARGTTSIGSESKEIAERAGVVSFFSCDPDERSWEIEELEHGSFTHCFLEAVKCQSCVTAEQVYEFLLREMPPLNSRYKKPPQRPYAVMQPAEKKGLPILTSSLIALRAAKQLESLLAQMGELGLDWKGDFTYPNAAIEFLHDMKQREPVGEDNNKLNLIERLVGKRVGARAFTTLWDASERRCVRATASAKPGTALEPLK